MYKPVTNCRACGNKELTRVFDLGLQPLANDFAANGAERKGFAPLTVLFCPQCALAQLSVVVNPRILYENYPYITSRSATMQGHFQLLWQAINLECTPESVIEIGSNDGHFLRFCKDNGAEHVCGIDPAGNLAPDAGLCGIASVVGCFDSETARCAMNLVPKPDVVIARHVFCHVDDWQQFMRDLDLTCQRETLVVIEVPYVMDLLLKHEFDTIYHEHLSYLSIRSMVALLEHTPFRLHKIIRFPIHGGSIAIMLRRRDYEQPSDESVLEYLAGEAGLSPDVWHSFKIHSNTRINRLRDKVHGLVKSGHAVCGYGASAKSTVWINACGLTASDLKFIVDETPQKQGAVSPGTDIPVVSPAFINKANRAILFAWNYQSEISAKEAGWVNGGGEFIIP